MLVASTELIRVTNQVNFSQPFVVVLTIVQNLLLQKEAYGL